MKTRSQLAAPEVESLWRSLERQLEGTGLETQPEVVGQVLELVSSPAANLRDFANVIRADAPLSGRLLRFANSAYFAQRQPVTNLERACVLLGLDRLKAISLGFYLSRSASDPASMLSRKIWGESVYRANLADQLARELIPAYAPEAFIIGLMLDAGIPLMCRLVGKPYAQLLKTQPSPTALYKAECETFPFTHVDCLAALCRRWKLPELLARPLQRHHSIPRSSGRENVMQSLHRIAYYAGALRLDDCAQAPQVDPLPMLADRVLGLDGPRLQEIIRRATEEYMAMHQVFCDVAEAIGGLSEVALHVHQQLIAITDEVILEQLSKPIPSSGTFSIAGQRVEVEVDNSGLAVAYLSDAHGNRLLSFSFRPGEQTADRILEGLGLEVGPGRETEDLDTFLQSLAA